MPGQAGLYLVDLLHHVKGRAHVFVQRQGGIGPDGQFVEQLGDGERAGGLHVCRVPVGHVAQDGADGVAGDEAVAVDQRAAYASAGAGGRFQEIQVAELAVFKLFQHMDHIIDAVHSQAVDAQRRLALPAVEGPADAKRRGG